MSDTTPSTTSTLLFGVILTFIGIVETFVRPKPDSLFGLAMLVFGPGMLLLWWSGKNDKPRLAIVANVVAGIGAVLMLIDLARDFL